jgi:phospholipid transport system substrate-binding protein
MRISPVLIALAGALMLLMSGAPQRPAAAAGNDAASFIASTADRVLKLARNQQLSHQQFKQQLHELADRDFDTPRIAQFVLGRYWRTASEQDRQQFIQAFEDYMVNVYATRFRQYSGANFKVTGQRQEGNTTMVTTEIDQGNGKPPAKVIWQVAKVGDGYKITDVSIEGVSQAVTYRQEFASVLEQQGGQVSALTQSLRQKASG